MMRNDEMLFFGLRPLPPENRCCWEGCRSRSFAFVLVFFNVVPCPPAQRAHAQAGERGGYKYTLHGVRPDAAFVLECTPTYDLPTEDDVSPNVALGKGPSIYVMDRTSLHDPRLVKHVIRTASLASKGSSRE